jgi:hypothetical protein
MDARQERILTTALEAVYDGYYPDLSSIDADIRAPFAVTRPVDGRSRVIQLIVDAIAERGEFSRLDPSPSSPPEPQIVKGGLKQRKIIAFDEG